MKISSEEWNALKPKSNPFLQYAFIQALTESGSIGGTTGWTPIYFKDEKGILFSFIKEHSYGEYIFDWEWARAYQSYNRQYYPKLTSLLPFTPVTTTHFIMPEFDPAAAKKLLDGYHDFYLKNGLSSSHFLFLPEQEIEFFRSQSYLIRESIQYHFFNDGYEDFEHFLIHLKTKKAKNLKKERDLPGISIKRIVGDDLTEAHAKEMYQFYLSTIDHKNSIDYLNEKFFVLIFERMKESILYVQASLEGKTIAGSLFFYDSEKLYGRYWGSNTFIQFLHFELCYYQGIEFCLERKLKVFEAGAQGEHKIARGFKPIRTYSAHSIKDKDFAPAIARFIEQEKVHIKNAIYDLSLQLPFK